MTTKQWLLITAVVILNIIIFGTLLEYRLADRRQEPTPTWVPYPTFTPRPLSTPTAILMPTLPPEPPTPTPVVHVTVLGETLEGIAYAYGITVEALQEANQISDPNDLRVGQQLIIPSKAP
jgi:LysM repeat protein